MARNTDRTGAQNINTDAPPPPVVQNNDSGGFSFVVPTEFVELPSQGKYYPEGHPLCGEESIEIRQMTAREEDMLTSRTLLKKGIALDRVIQSLIVDNRVDADALLIGDRNAIIVAMRVSGYGSAYETSVSCPACGETQQYSFNLNEGVVYDGADSKTLDVTNNNDGTFEVTLPRTKVSVRFKLLTGTDEKALVKAMEVSRKKKSPEHVVTNQMANMIVAVNGDTSHQALDYFINNAPSIDARHLRLAYRLTAPNIDLTQSFECKECDHERPMEVPLTADFFWPDR